MAVNDKDKPRTGLQATMARLSRPMYEQAPTAQEIYRGVGPRQAAHAVGSEMRKLPGQISSAASTTGQVASGVVGSAPQVVRGLANSTGTAARNFAGTDFRGAGSSFASSVGQTATGLGDTLGPPARQLARRGAEGVANVAMDRIRPYAETGGALAAGLRGDALPQRPAASTPATAPATSGRAPLLPGLVRATGDAIRGVQATNLMRPNLAAGIPTAASGAAPQPAAPAPVMIDRVLPDGSFASQQRATPPQGPRPGDMNTFTGRDGQTRRVDVRATPADAATPYGVPSLSRPQPSQAASQYGIPSLARPQPGQGTPALNLTRPTANPAGQRAAILDPRSSASEMVRRANAAMQSARVRSPAANTRSQMQRHYDAAGAERDFWLNQAGSLGSDAQARFLAGQQLRSQEGQTAAGLATQQNIADGRNATDLQRGFADNAARMQVAQTQQQGAMDRLNLDLSRPQPPITLADGTLAQLGPDGTLKPYTMPDGSAARGLQRPQRDYMAEARLRALGLADAAVLRNAELSPDARAAQLAANQQRYGGGGENSAPDGYSVEGTTPDGRTVYRDANGNRFVSG